MLKVVPPPSTFVTQESTTPESPPLAGRAWRQSVGLQDVQFVAAKESTTLGALIESKFKPINDPDAPPSPEHDAEAGADQVHKNAALESPLAGQTLQNATAGRVSQPSSPTKASKQSLRSFTDDAPSVASTSKPAIQELFSGIVPCTWPKGSNKVGSGLVNQGNTCFINSVLQCLLYTPPLLHMLLRHKRGQCPAASKSFCMNCSLGEVALNVYRNERGYVMPFAVTKNLNHIAKHMRRGRQEDAHEFLRYLIDALQKSELVGLPPKLDPKIAETTWVHKIFGGRLRSRVTCTRCGHHSDTDESCLDLSLDLDKASTVEQALSNFVRPEKLSGENKYKCEKCKIPVNAEKQFTIHQAPQVLTIHLKRFSMTGRKVTRFIEYPQSVDLQPYMSKGQYGSKYFLYGIISHAGGGPHSGHYYAHIKSSLGKWHEMNDEMVSTPLKAPMSLQSAYVLFYLRDPSAQLDQVIQGSKTPIPTPKRRIDCDDVEDSTSPPLKKNKSLPYPALNTDSSKAEDVGVPLDVSKVQRSATLPTLNLAGEILQKKIQAHKMGVKVKAGEATTATSVVTASANKMLVDYPDEESEPEDQTAEDGPLQSATDTTTKDPGASSKADDPYPVQPRADKFIGPILPPSRDASTIVSTSETPEECSPNKPVAAGSSIKPSSNQTPAATDNNSSAPTEQHQPASPVTSFYARPSKDRHPPRHHEKQSPHYSHKRHHPYGHDDRTNGHRRGSKEHDRVRGGRHGGRDGSNGFDRHRRNSWDGRGRDYRSSGSGNPYSGGLGHDTLRHLKSSPRSKREDHQHNVGPIRRPPLAKSMKRKFP